MRRFRVWFVVGSIWATLALALLPPGGLHTARASGMVGDGSPASCTEAAFEAALAGGGTVLFNCGPAMHTIYFSGQKSINLDTLIEGHGKITLDGQGAQRLFDVGAALTLRNIELAHGYFNGDGGAIRVTPEGELRVENSTIRDSQATASGGAILSFGPVTITDSVLEGNRALNGGALYPRFPGAVTTITGSVLTGNQATDPFNAWGGAILAWDGAEVTIQESDFYTNSARAGGAVYAYLGSALVVTDSQFFDNYALYGGGLYNGGNANLRLERSVLAANRASYGGAGLDNRGKASLSDVTFADNAALGQGGGLHNMGSVTLSVVSFLQNQAGGNGGGMQNYGQVEMVDVSFTSNSSQEDGGGLSNTGTADLRNVTFQANSSERSGGGVYNDENLSVINSTFSGNQARNGGGLLNTGVENTVAYSTFLGNSATQSGGGLMAYSGPVLVTGSIVAGSKAGDDCDGEVIDEGFNLATDSSCGFNQAADVLLGPLADNGGLTLTHLPLPGSPAIDAAGGNDCQGEDQRWVIRPVDGDGDGVALCDVGAVEAQPVRLLFLPAMRR